MARPSWLLLCVGTGALGCGSSDPSFEPLVAAPEPPPSCRDLEPLCGPAGNESCCTTLEVPGGAFNRSSDPAFPATVSPFYLDKYETTVSRFRAFVRDFDRWRAAGHPMEGEGAHPKIANTGWQKEWSADLPKTASALVDAVLCDRDFQTYSDVAGEHDLLPQNCLNSYEATAFCLWDGGRLPTEAEWNFAAAGGDEQRLYPWGEETPEPGRSHAVYTCSFFGDRKCQFEDIAPVGSIPAGNARWGHSDMAGNVFEWNFDWLHAYVNPCHDCAYTDKTLYRVIRGGYFITVGTNLRTDNRTNHTPDNHIDYLGVRCARDLVR